MKPIHEVHEDILFIYSKALNRIKRDGHLEKTPQGIKVHPSITVLKTCIDQLIKTKALVNVDELVDQLDID